MEKGSLEYRTNRVWVDDNGIIVEQSHHCILTYAQYSTPKNANVQTL